MPHSTMLVGKVHQKAMFLAISARTDKASRKQKRPLLALRDRGSVGKNRNVITKKPMVLSSEKLSKRVSIWQKKLKKTEMLIFCNTVIYVLEL